jgi:prepilin-type N-terminal cleavage/methylation domain-containing protein
VQQALTGERQPLSLFLIRAMSPRGRRESGVTLVELLVVVGIIGALSAIAIPSYSKLRLTVIEVGVTADLRAMASTQEMFYINPVPVSPSSMTVTNKRYARLHELNSFASGGFGKTVSTYYIDKGPVRYSMVPIWPTRLALETSYRIQAQGNSGLTFLYEVDQTGAVKKIR